MEKPSASDDSFKAFLEKIQTQNQRGFITQLLQVKAEREIAGEDNDKREEQLDLSNKLLGDIKNSITGNEPVAAPAKISKIRPKRKGKSAEEEKDPRGFFEIIKDEVKAAPGRIRDNLIGYNPKKLDSKKKKTEVDIAGIEPSAPEPVTTADAAPVSAPVSAPVTAKPQITGINPESDNIRDSAEIAADYEKEDIELSKQMLGVMREQLTSLKNIQETLALNLRASDRGGKAKSSGSGDGGGSSGGIDLPDIIPGGGSDKPGKEKPKAKTPKGKIPKGKIPIPGKLGMGAIGGRIALGTGLAGLALGAYEASEFLDETGYGDKMAEGAGQNAEKAFKENVAPTIDPVKAGVTKEQAIAALENGSPRDIEKLGGKDALMKIAGSTPDVQPKESVSGGKGSKAEAAKAAPSRYEVNGKPATKEQHDAATKAGTATMDAVRNLKPDDLLQRTQGAQSKETVTGGPGSKAAAVQPSGGDKFRDALSNAVGSAKQMVSNGEVDPKHLDEAVDQVMANVEGVSPQSANIIEKAVRAELQKGVKNPVKPVRSEAGVVAFDKAYSEARSDGKSVQESKEIGNKTRNTVDTAATPEAKSIETVTGGPGSKAAASSPAPAADKHSVTKYMVNDRPATKEEYDASQTRMAKMQASVQNLKPADLLAGIGKEVQPKETVIGDLPAYGDGGIVTEPQIALVGEKGPEAIIPLKGGATPVESITANKKSSKKSSPLGDLPIPELPAQDGDLGDGRTVITNRDGTKTYSGDFGSFTYNKAGKAIKYAAPSMFGVSKSIDLTTGSITEGYIDGPMRLSQTTDVEGKKTSSSAEYNLGAAKLRQETNAEGKNTNTAYVPFEDETHVVPMNSEADREQFDAAMQTQNRAALPGTIIPTTPTRSGQEVAKTTTENTDMEREASRGSGNNNTIVSNNVNNNNTTKFVPMKPTARPESTGSALDRHTNKVSVFY